MDEQKIKVTFEMHVNWITRDILIMFKKKLFSSLSTLFFLYISCFFVLMRWKHKNVFFSPLLWVTLTFDAYSACVWHKHIQYISVWVAAFLISKELDQRKWVAATGQNRQTNVKVPSRTLEIMVNKPSVS